MPFLCAFYQVKFNKVHLQRIGSHKHLFWWSLLVMVSCYFIIKVNFTQLPIFGRQKKKFKKIWQQSIEMPRSEILWRWHNMGTFLIIYMLWMFRVFLKKEIDSSIHLKKKKIKNEWMVAICLSRFTNCGYCVSKFRQHFNSNHTNIFDVADFLHSSSCPHGTLLHQSSSQTSHSELC